MDYKGPNVFSNSTESFPIEDRNISEYKKVYHILDELGCSNLKGQFSEHQIQNPMGHFSILLWLTPDDFTRQWEKCLGSLGLNNSSKSQPFACALNAVNNIRNKATDSALAYMESEEELKVFLKEVGLPAGPVFAFVKLWFRYKNNPDNVELDTKLLVHNKPIKKLDTAADDKNTQTDNVKTSDASTQTMRLVSPYPHLTDPYEIFQTYPSLAYHLPPSMPRMPLPGSLAPHEAGTYGPSSWGYTLPSVYPESSNYNTVEHANMTEISGINGLDKNSFDPLENFCPHESDASAVVPLEKTGSEVSIENDGTQSVSTQYSLFPNTEPLCSPKTSHNNLVDEKDDVMISRLLQAEQEREQRSYATALKDHKEDHSLPNSTHSDLLSSPPAGRSRSSSTASGSNLSRSASSTDYHPLSPTRETQGIPIKSPPNRPYVGVDDIDPQQKATITKFRNVSSLSNPSFSDFFDNLPETPEYTEASREKNVKAGWRPHSGKHEKSGRRLDFRPQYIDKEGRVRHGVRVRGALKSMECWLHTNSKPPIDCLFAHSRIGDTLEFICIRCTYEKGRNYECRDKKGHAAFVCNLGPYRAVNGEKWRGKVEPSS